MTNWTTPVTWATNDDTPAADLNAYLRDNIKHLRENTWDKFEDIVLPAPTAAIDFLAIPQTHKHLIVITQARREVSGIGNVAAHFNGDSTAANYLYEDIRANISTAASEQQTAHAGSCLLGMASGSDISPSSVPGVGLGFIANYSRSTWRKNTFGFAGCYAATNSPFLLWRWGYWRNAAAITRLQIFETNNNSRFIAGSRFTLYGVPG